MSKKLYEKAQASAAWRDWMDALPPVERAERQALEAQRQRMAAAVETLEDLGGVVVGWLPREKLKVHPY